MNCPTCGNAMVTLELADIEIDHCLHCGGIWLDTGELELLLDDSRKARQLLDSFQEVPAALEPPRRCPICEKKMTKIAVGASKPPLVIDRCRRTDGIWLDKSEFQEVLSRGGLDRNNRIWGLLVDVFGQGEQR